jgi:hypothetical protein
MKLSAVHGSNLRRADQPCGGYLRLLQSAPEVRPQFAAVTMKEAALGAK